MRTPPPIAVLLLGLTTFTTLAGAPRSTSAWPAPEPPRGYQLTEDAGFQEGCFDPCQCPLLDTRPLEGGFALLETTSEGNARHFEVIEVAWVIPRYDGTTWNVSGAGHYWFDPMAGTEQMVLDLRIADRDVEHFDSRILEKAVEWPYLELAVTVNDFFCHDIVFTIHAVPTTAIPVEDGPSWGTMKRAFLR